MGLNKFNECVFSFSTAKTTAPGRKQFISMVYLNEQIIKGPQTLPNLLAALEPRLLHLAFQHFHLGNVP
jgi:hypothetical protein